MFNYLRAETYRLLHKKSLFIFLAIITIGYLLIIFSRSGNLSEALILKDVDLFTLLPPLVGGVLFAAIYTDDLNSKNLSTLVGFGLAKIKVVATKFILATAVSALLFGLVPLVMYLAYTVLGCPVSGQTMVRIYLAILRYFLLTVSFMALSGVVVYGLQRSTVAIVTYVVLSLGMIAQLLKMLFNTHFVTGILPNANQHLPSNIVDQLHANLATGSGPIIWLGTELVIYVIIAIIISTILFNRKEMEF
jgi:ABC-type transport system involved in multi-copper enzyme maturation permease subunit